MHGVLVMDRLLLMLMLMLRVLVLDVVVMMGERRARARRCKHARRWLVERVERLCPDRRPDPEEVEVRTSACLGKTHEARSRSPDLAFEAESFALLRFLKVRAGQEVVQVGRALEPVSPRRDRP